MRELEKKRIAAFLSQTDENGVTNAEKAGGSTAAPDGCPGVIQDADGRFIGFGIHILNESVYPIEKFELFLRDKDLTGRLDLSGCSDLVFLDVYRNAISSADVTGQTAMRILGEHRDLLDALAKQLVEKETISRSEFNDLMTGKLTPGAQPPFVQPAQGTVT